MAPHRLLLAIGFHHEAIALHTTGYVYKPRHFFQAKFHQEIVKKENTGSESDQSAAFKENNLLVEDGMDMWDALSQIPEMGKP